MSDESDHPVSLGEARVLRETDKAIFVEVGDDQAWIPKSVVHDNSEVWNTENGKGELIVKAWFARKEGWE